MAAISSKLSEKKVYIGADILNRGVYFMGNSGGQLTD
jgi:hypothetical protein